MSSIKYKGQTYSGASSIEDASHVIATDASGNLTTVQALLDAGAGIVELTQAQYDALPTATKNDGRIYAITDGTVSAIAEDVRYDNTNSGLTASNVQDAVDEITTTVSENFDDVFGDFASIETSSTASKAYAVGDYLVYDSKFYKVTTAITQGDTIVPDTNVEQTTVADEFSNASNVDYSNTTSGLAATNVQGAVDELNSNKAENNISGTGYCKMPDGTLIQWGGTPNVKSGDVISFPFEFATSSGLRVFIQPKYNAYTTIQCNFIYSNLRKGSFTAHAYNTETKDLSTSTTLVFDWFAIGRWK